MNYFLRNSNKSLPPRNKLIYTYIITFFLFQSQAYAQLVPSNNIGKEVTFDLGNFKNNSVRNIASNGLISNFTTQFPNANGILTNFTFNEELISTQKIKDISTLAGVSSDGKTLIKITIAGNTLDGIMKTPEGYFFLEPIKGSLNQYLVYAMSDVDISNIKCNVGDDFDKKKISGPVINSVSPFPVGGSLRKYRMAAAATGEFVTQFVTQEIALAKIVSLINAANLIYELEAAIRFELITKTTNYSILFTDPTTDPFTPNLSFASAAASQAGFDNMNTNASLLYSEYDVGHTFSIYSSSQVSAQGQAGPYPCYDIYKASGWTEWSTAAVFPSYLGLVVGVFVHEVGHQFSAWHTYNATGGTIGNPTFCLDGWSDTDAIEPGSGNSLMSYGNNCVYPTNYTLTGDNGLNYFNTKSLEKIYNYVTGNYISGVNACFTPVSTGNTPPVANAGADVSIPKGTPFRLNGTATDANGDILTYTWDQYDVATSNDKGAFGSLISGNGGYTAVNSTTAPLFRSAQSSTSTERTFPSLSYILNDANNPADNVGEDLPQVARNMHFRFTVRDNHANGGGVDSDEITVNVVSSGPFEIASQNTATLWFYNGTNTADITWNVNGTNVAPLSTTDVKISFSTDGGQTFPVVLAASTPNDGSHSITIPNNFTAQGRIKIEAIGNVYFDINNVDITITNTCSPETTSITPTSAVSAEAGSSALNLGLDSYGATISSFSGTLESTDLAGGLVADNNGSCQFYGGNATKYDIYSFKVVTPGTYTFTISGHPFYTVFSLYNGLINPSSFCTNWMASTFVQTDVNSIYTYITKDLSVGTYYIMVSSFSSSNPTLPASYTITPSGGNIYSFAPAVGSPYAYTYVVVNNAGNIVDFNETSDLANSATYGADTYTVYGLSYQGGANLSSYIGTSFSSFQSLLSANTVCGEISTNSKTVTITPCTAAAAPSTTSGNRCGTGTVALSAAGCAGTYNWYAASSGGSSLGSLSSYTTPSLSTTTIYYVNCTVGGCTSSRSLVTATITAIPSVPTTTPNSSCGTGTVALSAAGCTGTYNWYAASSGGSSLGSLSSYTTPSISTTTTYYVDCTVGGCTSSRSSAAATVNSIPTAPTVNSPTVNSGQTAALTASGCIGTINWYTVATGGTILNTGTSYTSTALSNPPSASYDYYAACVVNLCSSSTRGKGTVTVNPDPCPTLTYNLTSTANDLSSGITKFEAGLEIKARNKLTGTSNVKYDSGKYILLEAGFLVDKGAVFSAYIDGCGNN
jgi:hypothetical protein